MTFFGFFYTPFMSNKMIVSVKCLNNETNILEDLYVSLFVSLLNMINNGKVCNFDILKPDKSAASQIIGERRR